MLSTGRLADELRLRHAAWLLAGVAGALNAGGFMAVQAYTSHVTGALSRAADALALGESLAAWTALQAVLAFFLGALASGLMVTYALRRRIRGHYAASVAVEALLLTAFGVFGARLGAGRGAVLLLSFIMGMHNAVITQVSKAVVRTTHMTGVVTDLGLELGRLLSHGPGTAKAGERSKLGLHAGLLGGFFGGGILGALAFKQWSYTAALPLAAILAGLSVRPLWRDLRARWRWWRRALPA